jgi:hypothetical protein
MREFRDAKAMALSLRQALTAKSVSVTHSESLELIAKTFGFDNWNILAAQIEAERRPMPEVATAEGSKNCSFCGKSQHDVAILIAGPEAFICNECVDLCTNVLEDRRIDRMVGEAPGRDPSAVALEIMRGMGGEQLLAYKASAEAWRDHIRRSLRQTAEALGRLETGKSWAPDEFAKARGWTRDPLAGKSREEIGSHRVALERQLEQVGQRLAAADHVLRERGDGSPR